ncbi:unnamed protein product [Cuscuta epithymum]|uniref:Uncharacterized protein n=1 Tax=Cuscuta epithymum TaxID=186058 RepID=A0AAV0E650_9ASTE|nr:unnamed protein product [Cuscuta epithymum]
MGCTSLGCHDSWQCYPTQPVRRLGLSQVWNQNKSGRHYITDESSLIIESKLFSFNISDSSICIRESKHGLFSAIEFDRNGAIWLCASLPKVLPGKSLFKSVLNKYITASLDGNNFGGFVRIFSGRILCLYQREKWSWFH